MRQTQEASKYSVSIETEYALAPLAMVAKFVRDFSEVLTGAGYPQGRNLRQLASSRINILVILLGHSLAYTAGQRT
jgi:hypothetical protein